MKKKKILTFISLGIVVLLVLHGLDDKTTNDASSNKATTQTKTTTNTPTTNTTKTNQTRTTTNTPSTNTTQTNQTSNTSVVKKGDRVLSIDLTLGDGGFDASLAAAKELHNEAVSMVVQWDELETAPGTYNPLYLAGANQVFANEDMAVTVGVNPIDTIPSRVPSDLRSKKMNDPEVIERYKKAVDYYLSLLDDIEIAAFVVGNEIDVNLANNGTLWQEYEEFYKAVAPHIKNKIGNKPVGVKLTHTNLVGNARSFAQSLNQHTDAVFVTYYPLNNDFSVKSPSVIGPEMEEVVKLYPGKKIYFLEFGYPSSPTLGSSEDRQVEAVKEMFKAWDKHRPNIPMITWFGISDYTTTELNVLVGYYGLGSGNFREYLGTLGLMRANGTKKKAFETYKLESRARGW